MRDGDEILFYYSGGVDVGNVDDKAIKWTITPSMEARVSRKDFIENLLSSKVAPLAPFNSLNGKKQSEYHSFLGEFLYQLYTMYSHLHFAYLEINVSTAFVHSHLCIFCALMYLAISGYE